MRKVLAVVAVLLCIAPLFSRETFVVDSYHVDVMVADDSKSTFNEFLDLDFKSPSHGIIRDIQYRFNPRPFVTLSADVSNIMANVESSLSYNDDFLSLRLGSPDRYVFGHVNYHIMYDFLLEDDGNREYDEWYVNLLSPAWDTDIGTFSFSVTFPHEIDPQRIWLTGGSYGSTAELDYMISSDLRTVSGIVYDLGPYSGVTLRAEFDEGYFSTKAVKKDYGSLFPVLYIIIAGLVIAFVYYSYYHLGRDKEIVSPVRFNPPEGLSSLDVGYIIDGAITFEKDILSMLFYFADKGYMRIKESGDGFTFIKLKEVEEDRPPYERNLFSLIFSTSDQCDMESLARRNFCQKATAKISPDVERYYEKNGTDFYAIGIPGTELYRALRSEGMKAEADQIRAFLAGHADRIRENGLHYPPHEVNYEQSIVAPAVSILLQAYELTGEESYLQEGMRHMNVLLLFNGRQPDYHLYETAIRHWDGYWFGKRRLYGDTFPHYWSTLTGVECGRLADILKKSSGAETIEETLQWEPYAKRAQDSLRGGLNLFRKDGTASCAYVYPHAVNGVAAGYYDPWANDQDWALYYAYKYWKFCVG